MYVLLVVNQLKFNVFWDGIIDKLAHFACPGNTRPRKHFTCYTKGIMRPRNQLAGGGV